MATLKNHGIDTLFGLTPLQSKLFPCDDKYNENEIADLQKSWAQVVKDKVLPFLGSIELEFAKFFHKTMGRPIKYISLLIILHIFKEMYDWTDEELVESVKFDKRFEYAFDIHYEELIVCQKTLHNFRALIQQNDMAHHIFDRATVHIIKLFHLNTSKQRLDSTHISSNIAKLSRLALFVRVIENFLRKLKKLDEPTYKSLPLRFAERYGKRRGYFADARSKKTKHRLGESATDMYYLIDHFKEHEIHSLKVMEQLERVFEEHCVISKTEDNTTITVNSPEDDVAVTSEKAVVKDKEQTSPSAKMPQEIESKKQITIKKGNDIPSGTLQNPADTDAAYGHKGVGYEATFAETCSADNPFQVITDVQTDSSDRSDQHKTLEVVDRLDAKDIKPKEMYGDGGFTSGENIVECAERGVDLQGNLVGDDKEPEKLKLADFAFEPDGTTVKTCPAGEQPTSQRAVKNRKQKAKSKQSFLVHFDVDKCKECELADICPVVLQKKNAALRFSRAQLASSLRRREQNTKVFKERNNIRAGIESTNAEMKKSQGLDRLRVRGQPRVDQTVFFKALACNIKRMVKYVQSVPKYELQPQNAGDLGASLANC